MIALCVIILLVVLILSSPFRIIIELDNMNTVITYKLAGISLYKSRKKIPEYFKTTEEKVYKINEESLKLAKRIELQYNFWKSILKLVNKHLTLKNIIIRINFGTGEASSAAVCSGVLWTAVYRILGVVGRIIPMEKNDVDITPDFNNEFFSIKGKCIIDGTFVYIIIIKLAYMIKNPKKKKRRK